ncbi:MAG: hypothetical protein IH987_11525 [Planctomycetes bacterium]|nr:hypothetical protein [Planctomycetota bacterium]
MPTSDRQLFSGARTTLKRKRATSRCEERVCRECGYDLQGAADDPVRCPECGTTSSLTGLAVAERRIDAALTYLEGLPVLCVACSLIAAVYYAVQLTVGTPWSRLPVTGFIMVFWLLLVFRYARESSWGQGWLPILIVFHLIGFLGVGFILLVWWSAILLLVYFLGGPSLDFGGGWATPACTGAFGVGALFVLIPFLYRKAKKLQAHHQRHSAIRLGQRRRDHPRRARVTLRASQVAGNH